MSFYAKNELLLIIYSDIDMDLRFVQDVICGTDNVVDEVYILFISVNGDSYTIRFLIASNSGFQVPEDKLEVTDKVLESIDLRTLRSMAPGKYDVIDWKFVRNNTIMDVKKQILDDEISVSEIGINIKTVSLKELHINDKIAFLSGKKFYLKRVSSKPKELFIEEVRTLSRLDHPNIIKIHALVISPSGGVVGMITPLANGGTLENNMNSHLRLLWLSQIRSAMKYSKDMGVPYTDIKPSNVVIHDDKAILIDFDGGVTKNWNMDKFEMYLTQQLS